VYSEGASAVNIALNACSSPARTRSDQRAFVYQDIDRPVVRE
jgi:hypothetical protein